MATTDAQTDNEEQLTLNQFDDVAPDSGDNCSDDTPSETLPIGAMFAHTTEGLGPVFRSVLPAVIRAGGGSPNAAGIEEVARKIADGGNDYSPPVRDPWGVSHWSCDSETFADEVLCVLDQVEADIVFVFNFEGVGDSVADVHDFVAGVFDRGAALHVVEYHVRLAPGTDAADAVRGALTGLDALGLSLHREATASDVRRWAGSDRVQWTGRPPLAFRVEGGELVPAENFDEVRAVLSAVDSEKMTKYRAAQRLGCSERTIGRALDRRELYGLDK